MSSDARISEIRARLEKATVWPWQTWSEGPEESVESVSLGRFVCHLNSNMRQYREDAALIANAPADITYLLERLDALMAERDAAVARAERAEAANTAGRRYMAAAEKMYALRAWDGNDKVARLWDKWRAALAAASEGSSLVTTRTITMRCHCGRGVTIGPDPWCEGCVQSAATCDCVPATQGEG
jgi:hypothetical protein